MLKANKEKVEIDKKLVKRVRIAIVRSEFNSQITESLEKKCLETLKEFGVGEKQVRVFSVPGALEIPVTAGMIASKSLADVIIALGAVIRGETYHFELVANECARGCMDVGLDFDVPVIFEVLACNNLKQAKERSANNDLNKGREAAIAAIKMIKVIKEIRNEV